MGFLSKIGSSIGSSSKGMFGNISSSASNVFNGLTNQISENFSAKNLSNMATNIAGGIFNKTLSSLKDGVLKGLMNGLSGYVNIPGLVAGESGDFYMQDYLYTLIQKGLFGLNGYSTFSDAYTTNSKEDIVKNDYAYIRNRLNGLNLTYKNEDTDGGQIADKELKNSTGWHQVLSLPQWGYDSFINERAMWQKGLTSPFGEPGYFYFKIFFKFDTQFGLLGGILNDADPVLGGHNTAMRYLNYLNGSQTDETNSGFYESLIPNERMRALIKFVKTLSYINCNAPWFFKSIKGLDKAGNPIVNEFTKEKNIEIECNVDAIDMRLSTLLDLYRFVCYDDFSNKEVIPENLRKFDMSILIFNTPIKTLHTAMRYGTYYPYKQAFANNDKYEHLMSFKLFEFNGCEIDINSIGSMIPGDINNETPFQIGKGIIKINYDRCTTYMSNEMNGILFGSTGFYYDYMLMNTVTNFKTFSKWFSWAKAGGDPFSLFTRHGTQTRKEMYQQKYEGLQSILTDVAEEYTKNNLIRVSGYGLGNLYGEDNIPTYPPDGTRVAGQPTEYFKAKIAHLHNRRNPIANLGGSLLASILSSSMDPNATLGYLEGYKERGPGSEWWKYKIDKLTSNFDHLWTTTPHKHEYRVAGHTITQNTYNKSAYVQNQEVDDALAAIDDANSIYSYALRDRLKASMQNLKERADRGEFVGPGSSAFNMKTNVMKSGSHASTEKPHVHNPKSSEKYIQRLRENTVKGETNLLNKPSHIDTTTPYKHNPTDSGNKYVQRLKENKINGETNLLNKPTHTFTTEPHTHSASGEDYVDRLKTNKVLGEDNLLNKPTHVYTTEPHKHSTSGEDYVDRLKTNKVAGEDNELFNPTHTFTTEPHKHNSSGEEYVDRLKTNKVQDADNELFNPTHQFTTEPHKHSTSGEDYVDRLKTNKVQDANNELFNPTHTFTTEPHKHSASGEDYVDRLKSNKVYDEDNMLNSPTHQFTTEPHTHGTSGEDYVDRLKINKVLDTDNELFNPTHTFTTEPHKHNPSGEDYVDRLKSNKIYDADNMLNNPTHTFTTEPHKHNPSGEEYVDRLKTNKVYDADNMLNNPTHQFTTEPHKHSTSGEEYVDRLKTNKVLDADNELFNPTHTFTTEPHKHNPSGEDYVDRLKSNKVYDTDNMLNNPSHTFTTEPHKHSTSGEDYVDRLKTNKVQDADNELFNPTHTFTTEPHKHSTSGEEYVDRLKTNKVLYADNTLFSPTHTFTTEPHKHSASGEDYVDRLKSNMIYDTDNMLNNPSHTFTTEPHKHNPSGEEYVDRLKSNKVLDTDNMLNSPSHTFTTEPHQHNASGENYIDRLKLNIVNDTENALNNPSHTFTTEPHTHKASGEEYVDRLKPNKKGS